MNCITSPCDVSLQEYYDACVDDSSENDSANENGEDSRAGLRASSQSPFSSRARLSLVHGTSVQRALRGRLVSLDGYRTPRGNGAPDAASLFASPLAAGASAPAPHRVVIDALCALRQAPSILFSPRYNTKSRSSDNIHKSSSPLWAPVREAHAVSAFAHASLAERAVARLLLAGANDVARAHSLLHAIRNNTARDDCPTLEDAFVDYAHSCTGAEGMRLAARLVLSRFTSVASELLQSVEQWVLNRQDEMSNDTAAGAMSIPVWRREVAELLLPLRRCIHIMESVDLATGDVVDRAAVLLDFLTVHMSALQDGNTFDQYCFHMTLLLHCCWPYVMLITYAIFGFVNDIDANVWRSSLPRIFRLSFSHIKSANSPTDGCTGTLPTDVLSLVLLCVGYERFEATEASGFFSEHRRAAFAALLSARSFVLRSLAVFARPGAALGAGRKRPAAAAAAEGGPGREWDSWPPAWRGAGGEVPLSLGAARWVLGVRDGGAPHDVPLLRESAGGALWLRPTLPAARWLAAALLVPIAQVVQRLHERRAVRLLATGPERRRSADVEVERPDTRDALDGEGRGATMRQAMASALVGVNFRDAVQLIVDVALCRDSERIVYTFLMRLLNEPHWWYRRDGTEYKCTGTASTFISTAFAEAVRGKTLGSCVRLSVKPKLENSSGDPAHEMIHTFAAFELVFSFPWDIELVLLPRVLSVAWTEYGETRETYKSFFWKARRHGQTHEDFTMCDAWSCCFGYLCSLYFTQLSLRQQRKRIQRRDVETYNIMSVLGTTQHGKRHAARVTRGLGSAYFELSFVVDSILGFTQHAVYAIAQELQSDITRVCVPNSCIALCQRLDVLLLRLCAVCFTVNTTHSKTIFANFQEADQIRERITAVLTIALDHSSFSVKQVTLRTQNAIEALVAVVRELPAVSVLSQHIKPLLVLLTFNRFYGH